MLPKKKQALDSSLKKKQYKICIEEEEEDMTEMIL